MSMGPLPCARPSPRSAVQPQYSESFTCSRAATLQYFRRRSSSQAQPDAHLVSGLPHLETARAASPSDNSVLKVPSLSSAGVRFENHVEGSNGRTRSGQPACDLRRYMPSVSTRGTKPRFCESTFLRKRSAALDAEPKQRSLSI